jgi:ankyrin repeat protein
VGDDVSPGTSADEELLEASERGDLTAVGQALHAGADVDAVGFSGNTPLILASMGRHLDVVRRLLEAGASVDAPGNSRRTALMEATLRGGVDVMRALLDAGADVNLTATLFGETALILAASGRARDTVPLLLKYHADPRIADRDKKTVLMWSVDLQFHQGGVPIDVIRPLVAAGAEPNAQDELGRTALMWASLSGSSPFTVRPAVLKELLDNGVDVNIRDVHGETALFALVRYVDDVVDITNGKRCIELLLAAGADPSVRNNAGKTARGIVDPRDIPVTELVRDMGLPE